MKTVVIHTPKGGAAKSLVSRELAVAAAMAGVQTALADLDPQGTTTGWYRRRKADTPALVTMGMDGRTDHISGAGVELLVIDTPPGTMLSWLSPILARSDVVLVPVRPTPDDLLAAAPIARSLASHPCWAWVLTQVPPRTRLLSSAVRQLAGLGRVAPPHLTFRADFPAAAIDGLAAIEFTGKAAEESAALYAYVATLLGDPDATPKV
jgi:chromosome partitioning protein